MRVCLCFLMLFLSACPAINGELGTENEGKRFKKKKATERAVTMPSSSEACLLFEYFKETKFQP